jgi:hypothetical protein
MRFPSSFCTGGGRAINNLKLGGPKTLQGKAKAGMPFFEQHLRPLGYKVRAGILSFPDGIPWDVGLDLHW